jgi:hypothetical protein
VYNDNNKNLNDLSDDEFIEMGLYIDDVDLGKIPLIFPSDTDDVRIRKERIIDERVDAITKSWNLEHNKGSNSLLRKIIHDIGDEVSKEFIQKEVKQDKVSQLLVKRFRRMQA